LRDGAYPPPWRAEFSIGIIAFLDSLRSLGMTRRI
jgi:hypothetical protein